MKYFLINSKKIMKKINFILATFLLLTLFSCQSIKQGLSGSKGNNNDEFLVQKKNPLVLPPDYEKLPTPNSYSNSEEEEDLGEDIEKLLGMMGKDEDQKTEEIESSSIEDMVLKKIKEN
jgi:hypothetical protein